MTAQRIIEKDPSVLYSRPRLKALFNDLCKNDIAKVNLLIIAYDLGILDAIRAKHPLDQLELGRFSKMMVQQHSVMQKKAEWAVNTWNGLFDAKTITAIRKWTKEKRDEETAQEAQARTATEEQEPNIVEDEPESFGGNVLQTRDDLSYERLYINPAFQEVPGRIFVPCGMGKSDFGFFVCGLERALTCTNPNADIYALVYNLLVRNSEIKTEDVPGYIKKFDTPFEISYKDVFRLSITLLLMVRHNYAKGDTLALNYSGDDQILNCAVGLINHYAAVFSRLVKVAPVALKVAQNRQGYPLSIKSNGGIRVQDCGKFVSNARELWFGRRITYRLSKNDIPDLEYILSVISPFDSFREGQFEALSSMLAQSTSVCIMPTGSGKSLIYYLASILQPLPLVVVSPTDILIRDQIWNLKKTHHIDNVAHLQLTTENSFQSFSLQNSLIYLTPMTFQNRNLLQRFMYINKGTKLIGKREVPIAKGALVAYIVLDEIHCLSNWGHDFRPEYLMLSRYLNKIMDNISLWGFTATANYAVVEDVQQQLNIPQECIISPVTYEKFNIEYHYRSMKNTGEMLKLVASLANSYSRRGERTIVFTKSDALSRNVADAIGDEADFFSSDNPDAYHHFVNGRCNILVSSEELGIGINFPNLRNIIHFGLPISKSEYVQEVGRAGRSGEKVNSVVLYLEGTEANVPPLMLKRMTDIETLSQLVKSLDNDYAEIYGKLTNHCPTMETMVSRLLALYKELDAGEKALYVNPYPRDTIEIVKQKLYMLYVVGYVNDWYPYCRSSKVDSTDILIDICSSDKESYVQDPGKMMRRMKARLRSYFDALGRNRAEIFKVERAETPESLIRIYVEWYYQKYLNQHKEAFLDLYEFVVGNTDGDSERISDEIQEHFALPFVEIKSDEERFCEMSIQDINGKISQGFSRKTLVNIERINSNRYSYRLDYLLFCGHLRMNNGFEISRLERILSQCTEKEKEVIAKGLKCLYPTCEPSERLEILNYLNSPGCGVPLTFSKFLDDVYRGQPKDIVYYGMVAHRLLPYFKVTGGASRAG